MFMKNSNPLPKIFNDRGTGLLNDYVSSGYGLPEPDE